jgi:AraC family transcriptional regulator
MCHCENCNPAMEPAIIEFGPFRTIGLNYIGKNQQGEIKQLWNNTTGIWSRMNEIQAPENFAAFGICRCLPGSTDGTFEYIAALTAEPSAPVPEGMVDVNIPSCTYAVFPVKGLNEIQSAWGTAMNWLAAHPEWEAYCDQAKGVCDCANHPCFELYDCEFPEKGSFKIYLPIKYKNGH